MSATINASPLAILGAEIAAHVGDAPCAASRVARRIGYSRSTVVHVARGDDRPSAALVLRLALVFGVDDATRARWLSLAGRPDGGVAGETFPCAAPRCDRAARRTRDRRSPLRLLCARCQACARGRARERGVALADAVDSIVDGGKSSKAFTCGWCERAGAAGRGDFERAPGGGMQCRDGHGCAVKRATRAA